MAKFEVRGPDGKRYEIQAPDQAAAMDAFNRMVGQQAAQPEGQGFGNNVAQQAGDGLFMGFGDEISARLNAMTGYDANTGTYGNWGTTYDDQLQAVRGQEQQFETDHPYVSAGAEIGGAVLPALAGVGVVAQSPSVLGRVGLGMGLGAAGGGVQGFGEGEDGLANRLWGGLTGAGMGAAIGGAIPVAAHVGKSLWRAGEGAIRDSRVAREVADALGVNRNTGGVVARLLAAEDPQAMQDALRRAGPDAMLGDASYSMTTALDTALQSPVAGVNVARRRVNDRAASGYTDIMDALVGGQQGPRMPPGVQQQRMAQAARGQVNPAYQRAYNTPIDYAAPEGQAIEELISRIPPRRANAAIQSATDRMIYDGMPSPQILANVADDGTVSLSQLPNVMQLDYMKRAFDEVAEDSKDAFTGRMSSDGAFANRIARDLREATKEAVPAYGDALEVAANDIRQRGAVRTGQGLLSASNSVEDALSDIADMTGAEKRGMVDGLIGQITEVLGNVRAVASDQNIDARQAAAAYSNLSSPNVKQKMAAAFGDRWPAIEETLDRAGAALALRAGVASNSKTGARAFVDALIKESVTPGALRQGKPFDAAKGVMSELTGASRAAVGRARDEVKAEIADLLTQQGDTPQKAISAVAQALSANPLRPAAGSGLEQGLLTVGGSSLPYLTEKTQRMLGLLP